MESPLQALAEMEGFEPPDGLTRQLISSQPRYDHFDTSPIVLTNYIKTIEKVKLFFRLSNFLRIKQAYIFYINFLVLELEKI